MLICFLSEALIKRYIKAYDKPNIWYSYQSSW